MKNSGIEWIGEIPEEWELTKVKHIGEYINGYPFKPSDWSDSGTPIIRIQNLTGNNSEYNYYSGPKLHQDYLILKNDYLISWSATLGVYIWHKEKGYLNQHIFKAIPNEEVINYDYFYWIANIFIAEIQSHMHGSAMKHVTKSIFDNFTIPLPKDIEEQIKISKALNSRIKLKNAIKQSIIEEINTLENYKKSIITEAVTKGLDKNVEMKDSGIEWIGEIPKHWKIIKLKLALSEKMKYGANEQGIDFSEDLPRYIRITDIEEENNLKSEGKQSLSEEKARGYILKDKTLLFARSGATVGKTFLYNEDLGRAAFAGYLISAKTDNSILLEKWLHYFTMTNSYSQWTGQVFSQSTIQNISAEKYSNMELPITNIKSQKAITEYLDEQCKLVNSVIQAKQKQLETLEEYKKSLIYEYVTGKKEVTDGEGI